MKKFLAICGLAVPLTLAAPAMADHGNPRNGGAEFADVLRAFVLSALEQRQLRAEPVQHRSHYRAERRIIPLARLTRQIQQRSGGVVTSIKLRPNGRVYKIEGIGPRGGFVTAKANAFTGEIFDVRRQDHGQRLGRAMRIPRLLRELRGHGYHGFDKVVRRDRNYIVRGLNAHNDPVRLTVRARNGRILDVAHARNYNAPRYHQTSSWGDFDRWIPGLQNQHYSGFGNVSVHDGYYRVDARDRRGRDVRLNVCSRSGRVLHREFR